MEAHALQIESCLCKADFFKGLPDPARRALARVCQLQQRARRDVVFHEGTRGNSMFVVAGGRVQLTRATEEGREVTIRVVEPPRSFAEVVLFERDRYPVTATCLVDTRLVEVPGAEIRRLLGDATFRNDFLAFLMGRMRFLTERIQELTLHDLEARFFAFLRQQYGEGEALTVDISKKDTAAAIGATPEALSRLLARLKDRGRLAWEGKTVTIS